MTKVILVDKNNQETGSLEVGEAHKIGKLHRSFSVLIFNQEKEVLIQRRSKNKTHAAELWSNTTCGHPLPDEDIKQSAQNRLLEEMGIQCEISLADTLAYEFKHENGLIENEYVHIFIGFTTDNPLPDQVEVCDWEWISIDDLYEEIIYDPDVFTHRFKLMSPNLKEYSSQQQEPVIR